VGSPPVVETVVDVVADVVADVADPVVGSAAAGVTAAGKSPLALPASARAEAAITSIALVQSNSIDAANSVQRRM
jgi:hypothetical protein